MDLSHHAIQQFVESLERSNYSPETVRAYRTDLLGLVNEMGELPADEFDAAARTYLTAHDGELAAKTTRRRFGAFRRFAEFAGIPDVLAARSYRLPDPGKPDPHPLPGGMADIKAMLEAAHDADERVLIALCGLCGLRVSEARSIRPSSIDYERKVLRVLGKGNKVRTVPLSAAAADIIIPVAEATLDDDLLVPSDDRRTRRVIERIGRHAGISRRVSSHDLRATFATAAYRKSLDLRAVQELMGHADPKTTVVYTQVAEDDMRAAAELMDVA